MCLILYKRNLFTVYLVLKKENLTVILVSKSHIILIFCIMQLINQFHRVRKVNSNVVVLTSVFLRVKFVMHTKIARMVKIPPPPPPPHSLNFFFASFIYQMQKCIPRAGLLVSDVTDMRSTLFSPVWIAFTSTRNQIYASDTSRNPLQSYQVFHSILDLLLKISFLSKLLLILLHYFITFG